MKVGVPQGSVSGPSLFLLYVEPLLKELKEAGIPAMMYADDLTIISRCDTGAEGAAIIRRAAAIVEKWATEHMMQINGSKSEVVVFTRSSHADNDKVNPHIVLGGEEARCVLMGSNETVKLLGVNVDVRCNFNIHAEKTAKSCQFRVAQLMTLAGANWGPLPSTLRNFQTAYLDSKLLYGAPATRDVLGKTATERLERVHRASARNITGLLDNTPNADVYLEASLPPLTMMADSRKYCYVARQLFQQQKWLLEEPPPPPSRSGLTHHPPPRAAWMQELTDLCRLNIHKQALEPSISKSSFAPWEASAQGVTFGYTSPSSEKEEKFANSEAALEKWRKLAELTLSTDGGADGAFSMAAALLTSRTWEGTRSYRQGCGPIASSYRTELIALRNGLLKLVLQAIGTTYRHDRPTLLVIMDNKGCLTALEKGPLRQKWACTNEIWDCIQHITALGWKVHFQFVYSHCGAPENEAVDRHTKKGQKPHCAAAPLFEPDVKALIKYSLLQRWIREPTSALIDDRRPLPRNDAAMNADPSPASATHRSMLVQNTLTPSSNVCPLTGVVMPRPELVQNGRYRTAVSEKFGSFYYTMRCQHDCCRLCHPQEGIAQSTAEGEDMAAALARTSRPAIDARHKQVTCEICNRVLSSWANLARHYTIKHPNETLVVKCQICGQVFPKPSSLPGHSRKCKPGSPASQPAANAASPAAKSIAKTVPKPVTTSAAKSVPKPAPTPAAKPAAKSAAAKCALTPAAKPAVKVAVKPTAQPAAKLASKSPAPPGAKATYKAAPAGAVPHTAAPAAEGTVTPASPTESEASSRASHPYSSTLPVASGIEGVPRETIIHWLDCPNTAQPRATLRVEELVTKYGRKFFFSHIFYLWVSSLVGTHTLTDADMALAETALRSTTAPTTTSTTIVPRNDCATEDEVLDRLFPAYENADDPDEDRVINALLGFLD